MDTLCVVCNRKMPDGTSHSIICGFFLVKPQRRLWNEKTGLLLVALLTLTQSAYAMLPLTENNIAAAQLYGSQRKGASDLELVAPWTVYDRKQTNRYGVGEKTVMYTPYLMAAIDAKSLAEMGELPQSAGA